MSKEQHPALLLSELELAQNPANLKHFENFIRTFATEPTDVHTFQETFEKWFLTHENELIKIKIEDKLPPTPHIPNDNIRPWARSKFFIWMYNQYLKDLKTVINEITAVKNSPKKEGEKS
jgi:hypothetical protein